MWFDYATTSRFLSFFNVWPPLIILFCSLTNLPPHSPHFSLSLSLSLSLPVVFLLASFFTLTTEDSANVHSSDRAPPLVQVKPFTLICTSVNAFFLFLFFLQNEKMTNKKKKKLLLVVCSTETDFSTTTHTHTHDTQKRLVKRNFLQGT